MAPPASLSAVAGCLSAPLPSGLFAFPWPGGRGSWRFSRRRLFSSQRKDLDILAQDLGPFIGVQLGAEPPQRRRIELEPSGAHGPGGRLQCRRQPFVDPRVGKVLGAHPAHSSVTTRIDARKIHNLSMIEAGVVGAAAPRKPVRAECSRGVRPARPGGRHGAWQRCRRWCHSASRRSGRPGWGMQSRSSSRARSGWSASTAWRADVNRVR